MTPVAATPLPVRDVLVVYDAARDDAPAAMSDEERCELAAATGSLVVHLPCGAALGSLDEVDMARAGWVRTSSDVGRLRETLRLVLGRYLDVVASGIIDFRDPEIEPEIQRARAALADPGVEELVGWVRFDGDDYHDFRYAGPSDLRAEGRRSKELAGYYAVYARRSDPPAR